MRHIGFVRGCVGAVVALLVLAPGAASADDEQEEPPPPFHPHSGLALTVDRTRQVVPSGARFVEGWAGEDAVLLAHHFEIAGGPGLSYHGFAPTLGNVGIQSWGAGAHVEVAFEVLRLARVPIFVRFDGALFAKHAVSERALRSTLSFTVHFR